MKLKHLLLLLPLPVMLTASFCTHEYVEDIRGVCFQQDVLPIFQSACTQSGCHNSIDREDGYDLTSYENIISKGVTPGNYKTSELYKVLVAATEFMPQSPYNRLTDDQITTIALWIEEGAHNTDCPDSGNCDTTSVSYNGTIAPIMQTYCNGCHSGSAPSGGYDCSTYAGMKALVDNQRLLGSVQQTSGFSAMPQGANKLSDCKINAIAAWINAGAPNN